MGFGMGCCCLQVTFQAQSIDEARFLYDQLTPLTPIMVNTLAAPLFTPTDLHSTASIGCSVTDMAWLSDGNRLPMERSLRHGRRSYERRTRIGSKRIVTHSLISAASSDSFLAAET